MVYELAQKTQIREIFGSLYSTTQIQPGKSFPRPYALWMVTKNAIEFKKRKFCEKVALDVMSVFFV